MDNPRSAEGALHVLGELTTFYAESGSAARRLVLLNMAWLLAGRHASMPVLMIDWDVDAPGLHTMFGSAAPRPGLLELFAACRAQLDVFGDTGASPDVLARAVLAAVDWQGYIERVDAGRPLFLLRAGRIDATYGERAAQCDWDGLFHACPALFRQFRIQLAQTFRHVLIDARCGRSAAVSVCTSLLPDKIVGIFSHSPRSLDGLCGMFQRAIDYRCSHEDEQRPLLLYPLPCAPASLNSEGCRTWRHGAGAGLPGYQATLEALMRACYGRPDISLDSYCDAIQLHHLDSGSTWQTLHALRDWFDDSYFPWQAHAELTLLRAVKAALAGFGDARVPPVTALAPVQFPALRRLHRPVYRDDNASTAADSSSGMTAPRRVRVFP